MVREAAVQLAVEHVERPPAGPSKTAGTTRPPMPLATSATTRSGRHASAASTNDRTWRAKALTANRRPAIAAPLSQRRSGGTGGSSAQVAHPGQLSTARR